MADCGAAVYSMDNLETSLYSWTQGWFEGHTQPKRWRSLPVGGPAWSVCSSYHQMPITLLTPCQPIEYNLIFISWWTLSVDQNITQRSLKTSSHHSYSSPLMGQHAGVNTHPHLPGCTSSATFSYTVQPMLWWLSVNICIIQWCNSDQTAADWWACSVPRGDLFAAHLLLLRCQTDLPLELLFLTNAVAKMVLMEKKKYISLWDAGMWLYCRNESGDAFREKSIVALLWLRFFQWKLSFNMISPSISSVLSAAQRGRIT